MFTFFFLTKFSVTKCSCVGILYSIVVSAKIAKTDLSKPFNTDYYDIHASKSPI